MKRLLQYAAWNWSMGRGPVSFLLGLGAAVECILLFAAAASPNQSHLGYGDLVESAGVLWVVAAVYLALPLCAQIPQEIAARHTHASCTALTLPMPRWALIAGRALSVLLWFVTGMALQIVLLTVMWGPTTALQDSVCAGCFQFDVTAKGQLWWALEDCSLMRVMIPTDWVGMLFTAIMLLVPSLLLPSALVHSGWKRTAAELAALADQAILTVLMFQALVWNIGWEQIVQSLQHSRAMAVSALIVAAIAAVLVAWGLWSVHRAELAE